MASTVNDPSYPVHRLAARAFIEEKELQGKLMTLNRFGITLLQLLTHGMSRDMD